MTGSGRRVRSIECVDDLPFYKTSTLIAVTIWRLSGELANKSFLSTPRIKVLTPSTPRIMRSFPSCTKLRSSAYTMPMAPSPALKTASPLPPSSMEVSAVIGGNVVRLMAEMMMLWRLKR